MKIIKSLKKLFGLEKESKNIVNLLLKVLTVRNEINDEVIIVGYDDNNVGELIDQIYAEFYLM